VQVGDDWHHDGVMNYGHLSSAVLREVLLSQPVKGSTLDYEQLSLSTYSRAPEASTEASTDAVLV
jgi:hypothetical protein